MTTWFPEEHKKREIEKYNYFYGIDMITKEQILEKAKLFSIPYQGIEKINNHNYLKFKFPRKTGYLPEQEEYSDSDVDNHYIIMPKAITENTGFLPGTEQEKLEKLPSQWLVKAVPNILYGTGYSGGKKGEGYLGIEFTNWLRNPSIEFRTEMNETTVRLGLENIKNEYFQSLLFEYLQVDFFNVTINDMDVGVIMDYIKEKFLNM